jgi:hypothetical protein
MRLAGRVLLALIGPGFGGVVYLYLTLPDVVH